MRATTYNSGVGTFGVHCPCCEASYGNLAENGEITCRYCGTHFDFKRPRINWIVVAFLAKAFISFLR